MLTVRLVGAVPAHIPLVRPAEDAPDYWADYLGTEPPCARLRLAGKSPRAAGALTVARWALFPRIAIDARGLADDVALGLAEGAVLRGWCWPTNRLRPDPEALRLCQVDLVLDHPDDVAARWQARVAPLRGTAFARNLIAEPSNSLTPAGFVARLGALAAAGVTVEVLEPAALRRQGLGALLAVGAGSAHPPRLLVLRWAGPKKIGMGKAPPVAFVGKGITFDTGGICIKPADGMWDMRADMAGAAACAGAMLALALRKSVTPAVAVLPLADNTTGAASYRPSDVLRSHSGRTIEVVDTDAEGRLVLADALSYAVRRFKPRAMIDLATLTGSIVTALGHHMAGLFGNDDALADAVLAAGTSVGEPAWRMPISARHRDDLHSDIADLRHCLTGRLLPDACHAAAFLREFAEGTPWAHLDIAGVESHEDADDDHAAGPTGFGVRLLDALVRTHFEGA